MAESWWVSLESGVGLNRKEEKGTDNVDRRVRIDNDGNMREE